MCIFCTHTVQTGDINRALINACVKGDVEKVTVLLDFGADVNYKDEVKISIVHVHCSRCYSDLTLQIGRSALWYASNAGRTECVKVLLKYGAQVDLPVRCDVM